MQERSNIGLQRLGHDQHRNLHHMHRLLHEFQVQQKINKSKRKSVMGPNEGGKEVINGGVREDVAYRFSRK